MKQTAVEWLVEQICGGAFKKSFKKVSKKLGSYHYYPYLYV